jgi:hypothetical protein
VETKPDSGATLKKLLKAWRQRFFDVTFEFMAGCPRTREAVSGKLQRLAKAHRLRKIAFTDMCIDGSPVINMMTFHISRTPANLARNIMNGVSRITREHPAVEFHFRFVTKI